MDRRAFLGSAGLMALSAAASAVAAEAPADAHAHHHHAGAYPAVAATAGDCVKYGQVCIDHCLSLLGNGDKSLAGCARSVQQMLPLCTALQQLAVQRSAYLPALAKVALQACQDCEKECRKHEKQHTQCLDCANACAACAKECERLLAA